ncbi:MAG TPA: hypothetical protein VEW66_07500, partial [Thermomicrobiales bacterium]|nr:hypothetical protein [Thermomicrobiales bacterium]
MALSGNWIGLTKSQTFLAESPSPLMSVYVYYLQEKMGPSVVWRLFEGQYRGGWSRAISEFISAAVVSAV